MDLNSDLGEGFGPWTLGDDDALLDVVTSANVACGFHAGDPSTIERTVTAAVARVEPASDVGARHHVQQRRVVGETPRAEALPEVGVEVEHGR